MRLLPVMVIWLACAGSRLSSRPDARGPGSSKPGQRRESASCRPQWATNATVGHGSTLGTALGRPASSSAILMKASIENAA
jgi:hypothetical protein